MTEKKYIPVLKCQKLTRLHNPVLSYTIPKKLFKPELIQQAGIQSNYFVLDFGYGSGTLSLMLKMMKLQTVLMSIEVDAKY